MPFMKTGSPEKGSVVLDDDEILKVDVKQDERRAEIREDEKSTEDEDEKAPR